MSERTTTAARHTGTDPAGPGPGTRTNASVPAPHHARRAAVSPLAPWMCAP
ncbi:hypothetical protein ACFY1J_32400 [Streptomyces sp. NPDC001406]|uniref:hypothetical protein n=1 Tax=Streptomyces sp. NPDC001406 TaxID=3364572 RepID=UPI0036C6CB49